MGQIIEMAIEAQFQNSINKIKQGTLQNNFGKASASAKPAVRKTIAVINEEPDQIVSRFDEIGAKKQD